jgi:hypothetical protein
MRLLHTRTLRLETFNGPKFPLYAILSHTWGEDEILFEHFESSNDRETKMEKKDWNKISNACQKARQHHPPLQYIWIDTCCIDKSSSAELSEAVNSMFRWYESAAICYAYLKDVEVRQTTAALENSMRKALWFTRGWTLQELIAPEVVVFFSADWETIGTKNSLRSIISSITGVDIGVLLKPELLLTMSVARRMYWAANRETTRPEDIAYCLMGIFNVNMPLLYGEGNKAFIRLQEEIIKDSEDQSLFAWQYPRDSTEQREKDDLENEGILAHHPIVFKNSFDIVPHRTNHAPYRTTNRGLKIQMPITDGTRSGENSSASFIGILSCHYETDLSCSIGIPLNRASERYCREKSSKLVLLRHEKAESAKLNTVHIQKSGKRPAEGAYSSYCYLHRYPSEVSFLKGIVVAAVPSPSTDGSDHIFEPDASDTQWNTVGRTVVLAAESEGYFGALEFTNPRGSSTNWGLLDGFTIVVKLFPSTFGVVAMIPWSRHERESFGFLRRTLEKHHNAATTSNTGNFRVVKGNLRVVLERKTIFDRDTYVVNIDYHPHDRSYPVDMTVNRVPDIRLLEADG